MKTRSPFRKVRRMLLTPFGRTNLIIILLTVVERACSTEPPGDPTVICPTFIAEADSKTCECQARFLETRPADFSLTWPGHSDTGFLQLTDVTRGDSGSVFTCLMVWNGYRRTASYTLQVAYGPDDIHTTVLGPRTFITDGTKPLTLTCRASDVNPSPVYIWDTNRCDIQDTETGTCTFTPDPLRDDGRQMRCNARSQVGINNMATAMFTVNLNYPPRNPPVITSYSPGGNQLKCSVSGGKPTVSDVIFSCENQERVGVTSITSRSENNTVSTSVIIDETRATNRTVLCTCRGVWESQNDLYTRTAQIVLPLEVREDICTNVHTVLTAGTVGALIGIVTCIVLFYCWEKKCFRKFKDWLDKHKIHETEIQV